MKYPDLPHYLSLGAGVQSSTMALMAAKGELTPMPTGAVFADTHGEPQKVYDWLDWLEFQLPFPVHRVSYGDLKADSLEVKVSKKSGKTYARMMIPLFIRKEDGSQGMIFRKCTRDYKVYPIIRFLRQLEEVPRGCKEPKIVQWLGISWDEQQRMKDPVDKWISNRWPLIDLKMRRGDCLRWMEKNGYPRPPRSACKYCPYHDNKEWARLKSESPEEFREVVEFERTFQKNAAEKDETMLGTPFLHPSLLPIDQVDFGEDQMELFSFDDECEGMCGV